MSVAVDLGEPAVLLRGEAEGEEVPVAELPAPAEIARGLGGLLALGAAGVLGGGGATALPVGLWSGLGALALTAPALLVVHQFVRGRAAPEAVVGTLGSAIAKGGALALGLVPLQLFFSCTTHRGTAFLALLLGCTAVGTLASAAAELVRWERRAGAVGGQLVAAGVLAWSWALITLFIGLRLGWGLL